MNRAQEIQNEIYRKMTDRRKMEITIEFMRMGKAFNTKKNEEISRTRKFNKNRSNA